MHCIINLPSAIVTLIWNNYMKTSYKAWYTSMLNNTHLHKNQNIQHFKKFYELPFQKSFFF